MIRLHTIEEIRDHWLRNRGQDGSDWEQALGAVYDLAMATPGRLEPGLWAWLDRNFPQIAEAAREAPSVRARRDDATSRHPQSPEEWLGPEAELAEANARAETVRLARDAGYYRRDVRFVDVRVVSCHGIPGSCRQGDRS